MLLNSNHNGPLMDSSLVGGPLADIGGSGAGYAGSRAPDTTNSAPFLGGQSNSGHKSFKQHNSQQAGVQQNGRTTAPTTAMKNLPLLHHHHHQPPQPQQQRPQQQKRSSLSVDYLQNLAPKLSLEPPSYVVFSNTTGTVIPCTPAMLIGNADPAPEIPLTNRHQVAPYRADQGPASGRQQHGLSYYQQHAPVPTSIHWKLTDGANVKQVPDLRYVRHDGALVFVPFASDSYRQDIHSAAYRCCLENSAGSLCSRTVHVRAVVDQSYRIEVYDEFVISGNTAVLRCQVPLFIREHVEIVAWLKDDQTVVGINSSSTLLDSVVHNQAKQQLTRYMMLPSGELYIKNTTKLDAGFYRCRTRHKLTLEQVTSVVGGRLIVNEPNGDLPMRLIDSHPIVWSREHETVIICVAVQSNPLTKYRWHKLNFDANNYNNENSNDNLDYLVSKLLNRDTNEDDNGDNSNRKNEFVDLSSFVQAKTGDSGAKDDQMFSPNRMLSTDSVTNLAEQNFKPNRIFQHDSCLVIDSATTKDSGIYYCDASNGISKERILSTVVVSSSSLTAQLEAYQKVTHLSSPPSIQRLPSRSLVVADVGRDVLLNCTINGYPYDTISWYKNSEQLFSTFVDVQLAPVFNSWQEQQGSDSGRVIKSPSSPLNPAQSYKGNARIKLIQPNVITIEAVRPSDRGVYQCFVSSSSSNGNNGAHSSAIGHQQTVATTASNNQADSMKSGADPIISKLLLKNFLNYIKYDNDTTATTTTQRLKSINILHDQHISAPDYSSLNQRYHEYQFSSQRDRLRSAQSSVQLDLGNSAPTLNSRFASEVVKQGQEISLKCTATGLPRPDITWQLDGEPVLDMMRANSDNGKESDSSNVAADAGVFSYVASVSTEQKPAKKQQMKFNDDASQLVPVNGDDSGADTGDADNKEPQLVIAADNGRFRLGSISGINGKVTSYLNISSIAVMDGGRYKCVASNSLDSVSHEARINVLGEPVVRPYQATNLTLIAGQKASLQCPVVGYPISSITWFHNGQRLPVNHRQRLEPISQSVGGQLELTNVERITDDGIYSCRVTSGNAGQPADGEPATGDAQINSAGAENDNSAGALVGRLQVIVRVAPLIDAQSLPEIIQANEGMRIKLICSVVQGDQPVEIKWFKRIYHQDIVESMQTSADESISVHNLDDSSLLTFKKITFNDGGMYSCSAKNDVSQVVRSTRIVVNVAPVWSLEPANQNVQLGHKLQIDCSAQGYPPPGVSWKRDRSLIWSQSEFNMENRWTPQSSAVSAAAAGTYLTGKLQPTASDSQTGSAPMQPDSDGGAQRQMAPIEFTEIISNYRQRILSNGTIIIEQVDQTDAGQYMCEVANGIGSGLSKVFKVTINVPPYFRHKFYAQTAKINERVELRCLVYGDQPMIVGWQKGKQQIDLINDNRYIVSEHRSKANIFESRMTINEADRNDSALYTCIATNQFGSDDTKLQLIIQEPPEAPKELRPARVLARSATLSFWTPYAGNMMIRRYLIQFKALQQLLDAPAMPAHNASDQSAAANRLAGDGDWHQVAVEAPMGAQGALPGQALSATAATMQQADNNNNNNGNSVVAKVELCCLQPYTKYLVRVIAKNDVGQSAPSEQIEFVTDEEVIGGPPLDVSVEATGAHSLKVKWRAPLAKLQHGMIRGYYIGYRSVSGASTYSNGPANQQADQASMIKSAMGKFSVSEQTSYTDSGLRSGVIIMNNGLTSARSDEEQYQYKNIQLDNGADLMSNSGAAAVANSLISSDGRKVTFSETGDPDSGKPTDSGGPKPDKPKIYSSYLTNLKRKSSYSIIVQAYNKVGAGPRSDAIVISTLDAAPPTSPTVDVVSVSYDQVMLTWFRKSPIQSGLETPGPTGPPSSQGVVRTASLQRALIAEEDQDDPLAFYTIHYRDDKSMNNWQQKRIDRRQPTPYTLMGLKCGSKHFIFMTATNSLGQSEPSETIATKTRGTPPIAANVQDFLFVNSTYVLLKLDTWHSSGCIIRSFTFKYKTVSQKQWIILEHQVHPTVQTTTITGNAIFSTKSPQNSYSHQSANRQQQQPPNNNEQNNPSSEALTLSISPNVHQIISDFVIRNLLSSTNYQLIVAASSDAGTTEIEYSFETANLSSSMVTVVSVNNLDGAGHPIFVQSQSRSMSEISSVSSSGGGPNGDQHHFGLSPFGQGSQLLYANNNLLRLCLVVGIIMASVFLMLAFGWFIRKNKSILMSFASSSNHSSSNGSSDQHGDNVSSYCPSHTNTISHYGAAESRLGTLLHADSRLMNIANNADLMAQQLALNRLEQIQQPAGYALGLAHKSNVLNSNDYGQIAGDQSMVNGQSGMVSGGHQDSDALQMNILDAVNKQQQQQQNIDGTNQIYKTLAHFNQHHRHVQHVQDTSINQSHDHDELTAAINNGDMMVAGGADFTGNDLAISASQQHQQQQQQQHHMTQQYNQEAAMNCKPPTQFIDGAYGRTVGQNLTLNQDCRLSTVNATWRNIGPDHQLHNGAVTLYAKPNKANNGNNLNDSGMCHQGATDCATDKPEEEPKLQSLAQSMSAHHLYAEPCAANGHRSKTLNTFISNRSHAINAANVQMSLDDINARYGTIRHHHRRLEQLQNNPNGQHQDQICSSGYDLGQNCQKSMPVQQPIALVQANNQQQQIAAACQQQNNRNDLQHQHQQSVADYEQNSATILNPMTLNSWTLQ